MWVIDKRNSIFSLNRTISLNQEHLISEHLKRKIQNENEIQRSRSEIDHLIVHNFKTYKSLVTILASSIKTSQADCLKYNKKAHDFGQEICEIIPQLQRLYGDKENSFHLLKNLQNRIKVFLDDEIINVRNLDNINGIIDEVLDELQGEEQFPHALLNDYNKIVSSSSFRRLQDKAQVFPLEVHDYARTRLTHSLEVASISREITDIIIRKQPWKKQNKKYGFDGYVLQRIVESASLLHDMGNPPYGHYGEDIIRKYFVEKWDSLKIVVDEGDEGKEVNVCKIINKPKKGPKDGVNVQLYNDFAAFDGNAQSLRVMTKLQRYRLGRPLEISAAILGAIIKYPYNSIEGFEKGKLGYFYSERDIVEQLKLFGSFKEYYRNPCSMILEAADDISYTTSDLDDAIKKGVITQSIFERELSQIKDDGDEYLLNFKEDYEYYIKKSVEERVEDPFAYTMSLMIYNLKKRLIMQTADAFCDNYDFIMQGIEYRGEKHIKEPKELLKFKSVYSREITKWISSLFKKYLYRNQDILKAEIKGETVMKKLLDEFTKAVLAMNFKVNPDTGDFKIQYNKKDYFHEYKVYCLISNNFIENFIEEYSHAESLDEKVYYKLKLAVDYVCGMTDSYAMECYQILSGIK